MMIRELCVTIVAVVGLTAVSYADDIAPKKDHPALQLLQRPDYSVELKANKNPNGNPTDPSGLAPLTRETNTPSVGLSIKAPLSK
ncbi:MAG TPA: hypothetical protein VFC45_00765 [Pseudolabrys sp.]|nr:hypothetical protein [Pseudolabrys sp.]